MDRCDVVVVGLGVMGAAASWQCAQSGADVIAFERGGPMHTVDLTPFSPDRFFGEPPARKM